MSLRVLVIDDDPDDRAAFRRVLEGVGWVAETVGMAATAIDREGRGPYWAIILDHRLPGGPTNDVLPRLRDRFPDTPILVALRQTNVSAAGHVLRLGADDYLLKPIDPDEVRVRVGRVAEHRQAVEAARAADEARERAEAGLRQTAEELTATTRQLWQAARLAGVGELAASIAHELNNPLATVSLRLEGVLAKTPAADSRHKPLEVIEVEVERMAGLVSNLLQFSRAGRDQVSTLDVGEEVSKTVALISHHLRKYRVRVETEFAPEVPVIRADRQQLRQVFLNLFTNAADAMLGGGLLLLRIRPASLPGWEPAVALEVADTGTGIQPAILPRVTDPFFTTKEEGKGTGLGLAICRRIVEQHHGSLEIESRVGEGTTVRVTLPVQPGKPVAGLRGG